MDLIHGKKRKLCVQQQRTMEILGTTSSIIQRRKVVLAHAALTWLEEKYQTELNQVEVNGVPLTDEEEDEMSEQEERDEEQREQDEEQEGNAFSRAFRSISSRV